MLMGRMATDRFVAAHERADVLTAPVDVGVQAVSNEQPTALAYDANRHGRAQGGQLLTDDCNELSVAPFHDGYGLLFHNREAILEPPMKWLMARKDCGEQALKPKLQPSIWQRLVRTSSSQAMKILTGISPPMRKQAAQRALGGNRGGTTSASTNAAPKAQPVSYTHLTLPTKA